MTLKQKPWHAFSRSAPTIRTPTPAVPLARARPPEPKALKNFLGSEAVDFAPFLVARKEAEEETKKRVKEQAVFIL